MPVGPKGEKRPADVIGNAAIKHYLSICIFFHPGKSSIVHL
jgi:hypothetical protein